jgi:tRNA(Ile)-lysidine synthase
VYKRQEDYNPQICRILGHTATVVADDYELLRHMLLEAWEQVLLEETPEQLTFDLSLWRSFPRSLQRGILREAIAHLRRSLRNINFVHVENAVWILREGRAGTRATLPAGLEAVLGYQRFAVGDEGVELTFDDLPLLTGEGMALAVPGVTQLADSGWEIATTVLAARALPAGWDANWDPWQAYLDAAVVGARPVLRVRRDGDRFQPLGMGGHSKLVGEVFTNDKVPAAIRDRWPLLIASQGDIAWVCGLRVDERARVTSQTTDVLHVRMAPRS